MPLDANTLSRLRSQMSRGELVLFTGAGFSTDAFNHRGQPLPSARDLKDELWKICYPGRERDESATLSELYSIALSRQRTQLITLLEDRLSVDPSALPDFYHLYFDTPWYRCYTLNIDDLVLAAVRKSDIRREIRAISATSERSDLGVQQRHNPQALEFVHLNGMLPDRPESLTFSENQYAQRIGNREPWYVRCVTDLGTRCVVFVGTELREVPLWQHMELRRRSSAAGRDLRPGSLLVTPTLSPSREEMLHDLRIEWVAGTAKSFAEEVLDPLREEAGKGFVFIQQMFRLKGAVTVPLVTELMVQNPTLDTDYLRGEEPHWADILQDRAIERSHENDLLVLAREVLAGQRPKTAIALLGTAGTGKSTSLMRLVVRLSADGIPVLWIDRDSEAGPTRIREQVRSHESGPLVLAIDDADLFGRQLLGMLRDLVPPRERFLFVFAVRSSKMDEISTGAANLHDFEIHEHVVPGLSDSDIDALLEVLERNRRLGALQGMTPAERRRVLAEQSGRQLLVAMIKATTGQEHKEKAETELLQLQAPQRYLYALVSVASMFRHYLTKDEILIAAGGAVSEGAVALDSLVARHLIAMMPPGAKYRARHRVIADIVAAKLQELGELKEVLVGLALAAATKIDPLLDRQDRSWRLLTRILNHSFLLRVVGPMEARQIYAELEQHLHYDYHYWLQRGSLEVERGDVRLAEHYLNPARSLAPDDYRVSTEYAYMLMRKAYEEPAQPSAAALMAQGMEMLEDVIALRGSLDPYPYHVYGSQGLSWVRRASLTASEKRRVLQNLVEIVEQGVAKHPHASELRQLLGDLRKEQLMSIVPRSK